MAKQDNVTPISRTFRSAAGLPERKDDKVLSNAKAEPNNLAQEPEGGYGGEGGIANTGAINSAEQTGQANAERQQKAAEEATAGEEPVGEEKPSGSDTE